MGNEPIKIVFDSIPVDAPLRITSDFGPRDTGIAGATKYHKGVDIGRDVKKEETLVLAAAPGIVKKSYWNDYRGNTVIIDHGGYETLYQHLKNPGPPVGTRLAAGQALGIMGNSSNPEKLKIAVHLHFELLVGGIPVDPEPYLRNIQNVSKEEVELTEAEIRKIVREELVEALASMDVSAAAEEPSSWAGEFWKWGKEKNLTDGRKPRAISTREQVITMLYKFSQLPTKK